MLIQSVLDVVTGILWIFQTPRLGRVLGASRNSLVGNTVIFTVRRSVGLVSESCGHYRSQNLSERHTFINELSSPLNKNYTNQKCDGHLCENNRLCWLWIGWMACASEWPYIRTIYVSNATRSPFPVKANASHCGGWKTAFLRSITSSSYHHYRHLLWRCLAHTWSLSDRERWA